MIPLHSCLELSKQKALSQLKREIRGQFHQYAYAQLLHTQIPKAQKDSQVKQLFALMGSVCVKGVCKQIDEIYLRREEWKNGRRKYWKENERRKSNLLFFPPCKHDKYITLNYN